MNTIVVKFGGSSLSDAEHVKKAADIVRSDTARQIVVVSAPGKRGPADQKVTDLLYSAYDARMAGEDFAPILQKIERRYQDIADELCLSVNLHEEFASISRRLEAEPSRDWMASRGEYLSARLFAAYMGFPFVEPQETIFFEENGALDADKTYAKLGEALYRSQKAVLPGFYGAEPGGSVRTFSRGGSDVTGAIAARAVNARLYENWTDVSGLSSADPRIVDIPHIIETITYTELRELSYMGATVLHEDAIFPVRAAGIPINIRNTNAPRDPGTMIVPEFRGGIRRRTVTGIAGRKGFSGIVVEKSMMNGEVGFGARLLKIFADHGVPFEHCPTGIDTMSVIVNTELFTERRDQILSDIRAELDPEIVSVNDGLSMIAVVGQGMAYARDSVSRIFNALSDAGVDIRLIDMGSGGLNVIIGVDDRDYERAIRAVYQATQDIM